MKIRPRIPVASAIRCVYPSPIPQEERAMLERMLCMTAIGFTVLFSGCSFNVNAPTMQPQPQGTDGIFVHITSGPEDAHRAMMGLHMAKMMSEDRPVLVYCDIDAVSLLTKDAEAIEMEPFGSSKDILEELIERDVTIMACPGCLKKAGYRPADLKDGIDMAEKDEFFEFTNGRVITIDY